MEPLRIRPLQPTAEATVSDRRPTICALVSTTPTSAPVRAVRLRVNGQDVTPRATVTRSLVTFRPPSDLPAGPVVVEVEAEDAAGKLDVFRWRFTVQPCSACAGLENDLTASRQETAELRRALSERGEELERLRARWSNEVTQLRQEVERTQDRLRQKELEFGSRWKSWIQEEAFLREQADQNVRAREAMARLLEAEREELAVLRAQLRRLASARDSSVVLAPPDHPPLAPPSVLVS